MNIVNATSCKVTLLYYCSCIIYTIVLCISSAVTKGAIATSYLLWSWAVAGPKEPASMATISSAALLIGSLGTIDVCMFKRTFSPPAVVVPLILGTYWLVLEALFVQNMRLGPPKRRCARVLKYRKGKWPIYYRVYFPKTFICGVDYGAKPRKSIFLQ